MEQYYKIDKNTFNSLFSKLRNESEDIDLINDIENALLENLSEEVTTYSELEFLKEKRMYLTAKAVHGEIDKVELEMLNNLSNLLSEIEK